MSKGYVYSSDDSRLFMIRCPYCGKENYALAVTSGQCAWCGYIAVEPTVHEENDNG